ncbi:MAG: tetratricopeptide repeat protein [Acidimicrobiales bacterium]
MSVTEPRKAAEPRRQLPRSYGSSFELPGEVKEEITGLTASKDAGSRERLLDMLANAAKAYDRGYFKESLQFSARVLRQLPGSASARELVGLSYYGLGKWHEASARLQWVVDTTGDVSQIPVLMDCHRAMGDYGTVSDLYDTLRRSSPLPDVLAEGRIVAAGSLADQGRILEGIELLEQAGVRKMIRNPKERHYRQWYVLGDLYEKAEHIATARLMFKRVSQCDAGVTDAKERLEFIGGAEAPRRRVTRVLVPEPEPKLEHHGKR